MKTDCMCQVCSMGLNEDQVCVYQVCYMGVNENSVYTKYVEWV